MDYQTLEQEARTMPGRPRTIPTEPPAVCKRARLYGGPLDGDIVDDHNGLLKLRYGSLLPGRVAVYILGAQRFERIRTDQTSSPHDTIIGTTEPRQGGSAYRAVRNVYRFAGWETI